MNKDKKKINVLIKRKGLFQEARKNGISRISKKGEVMLDDLILNSIENIFLGVKEQMDVLGKKILNEDVVESFIKNREKKEEYDY
jgi:hypothetical protein